MVIVGDPPCYEIIMGKKGRGTIKPLQIPFSDSVSQLDASWSRFLCFYPPHWTDRKGRQRQARNLKLLLRDMEIHSKAIEDAKLLALKAAEDAAKEAALLIRIEYGELDIFEDRC
jgi:hypothetical protein